MNEKEELLKLRRLRELQAKAAGPSAPPEYAQRAAAMSPRDISIARSKNDEFGDYLRQQASQRQTGETDADMFRRQYGGLSETPRPGTGQGMARAALQGGTFGFGDEIVAGGASAMDALIRGDDIGQAYDARLAAERQKIDQFREDSPVAAYGSEIAGAIPTAVLLPQFGATQGLGLLGRVGVGALNAGLQGFGYGFGTGEGGAGERMKSAATTGVLSGAIGGAAPLVGAGARNLAERAMSIPAARSVGMSRPAYDVMRRAMGADDSLTGVGAARLRAVGPDAMLADAGPNAMGLLDTAVQRSGPAATAARQAVEGRVNDASRAVASALDDAFGRPAGIRTVERGLRTGTAAARQSAYDVAYSMPIDYSADVGRRIESIIRERVPPSAIRAANALMRADGDRSRQILFNIAPDGTVTFRQMPDVRQIDYITRGLNEVANKADGMGKLGGTTQIGRAYANLSREIRNLTRQAVPEYGQALETAAEPIAARNALLLGRSALSARVARDELADAVSGMTGAERSYVAQGIRSQIDESLANVKRAMTDGNMDAREAVKALRDLSSRASRDKVETVIGADRAQALFSELDRAMAAFEMRAGVAANSRTFARQSLDNAVRAQTEDGILNAVRSGQPLNVGRRFVQALTGRTESDKARIADQTFSDIVQALTGPRGPQAIAALQRLEQSASRIPMQSEEYRRLVEMALRRNAVVAGPAAEQFR